MVREKGVGLTTRKVGSDRRHLRVSESQEALIRP